MKNKDNEKHEQRDLFGIPAPNFEPLPTPKKRSLFVTAADDRKAISKRAGTKIDHKHVRKIFGWAKTGAKLHGLLDCRQRVYQGGGELHNFVYWKQRLVSLSLEVWEKIQTAETIELIDHKNNECWRTSMDFARRTGTIYSAGVGQRWGIPLRYFEVEGADGKIRIEAEDVSDSES